MTTTLFALPTGSAEPTHVQADTVEFFPKEKRLVLKGNAHIAQGKNVLHAPYMEYDLDSKQLKTTKSRSERTHIRIIPDKEKHGSLRSPTP